MERDWRVWRVIPMSMNIMEDTGEVVVIEDDEVGFDFFKRGQCIYKCRICDRKYFDSLDFWSHDCLGGMPPAEYKKEHFTHYFRRRFHKCRVPECNKTMDWDRSKMTTHLKKNHPSLPLRRYYDDFVKKVSK